MPEPSDNKTIAPWQDNVIAILASYADAGECITYAALAAQALIPAPHRIHKLTQFLEALIQQDVEQKRAIRAALVISKTGTKMPAAGFFMHCEALGIFSKDIFSSPQDFHQDCLERLFNPDKEA